MKQLAATQSCPCGRLRGAGKAGKQAVYEDCCGRWLEAAPQTAQPPDAESLMRSRYTAFVCERADHLLATWHPDTRPPSLDFEPRAQWLGLQVRRHGVIDAEHAIVEFVARHRVGGRAVRLHETSRFVRQGGQWWYVDGDMAPIS